MAFHFTCPYCFKKTLVDEALAGRSGPCVSCGKSITVPEPPARLTAAGSTRSRTQAKATQPAGGQRKVLAWLMQSVALVVVAVVLIAGSGYVLWPTLEGMKARRDKVASLNNLQRIAAALNAYALEYGSYPPPVVFDTAGQPLYSWRVLILEQLGELQLSAEFRKDLSWDAPENVSLLTRCPKVYVSPTELSAGTGAEASYALITGRGTLFPETGPLGFSDVVDGREQTLLVVECCQANAEWSRPWDIDIAKLNTRIGARGAHSIGGNHAGGAVVAFADETPGWLPAELSPALLHGLISPAGGESLDTSAYSVR